MILTNESSMPLRIDNLTAGELRLALSIDPDELPEEESLAIKDFIRRIGGRENAILAVEMLEETEEADPR
jgi:hypothetical protein